MIYTLDNGIRVLHIEEKSEVSYCGFAIDAGTRDENKDEHGIAHFVEHMLFKATANRSNWQILDRIEAIGGELDAYTTKEETFIYACVAEKHTERAIELLSDIVFNSIFPQVQILKEKSVIEDEIQSYLDSPSELIYDDFEEIIFKNSSLEHNILGDEKLFDTFTTKKLQNFIKRCYTTDKILFFIRGNVTFDKLLKICDKHISVEKSQRNFTRTLPQNYTPQTIEKQRDTFQTHCIIGNIAQSISFEQRLLQTLLNNIAGGPFMSSRLNMAVRERNGLVYSIDSSLTHYTDISYWSVYFGCDEQNYKKCISLIYNELEKLQKAEISEYQLKKVKQQFSGHLLIISQNKENQLLAMAKSVLHYNHFHTKEEAIKIIQKISAAEIHKEAQQLFDFDKLTRLKFL